MMKARTKRFFASLVTISVAVLFLVIGTAYGLIQPMLSIAILTVGVSLLLLPKLTKRPLPSVLIPEFVPRQKLAHSVGGFMIFGLGFFYGRSAAMVLISACTATYIVYEAVRWIYFRESFYITTVVYWLGSPEESMGRPYYSPIYAFLGLLTAYTLFSLEAASVSAIVLSVGDGVAPVAGRFMGMMRNPLNQRKTVGGSLFGFLAAFAVCLIFARPLVAACGCAVGMLVECLPMRIDDNFSAPVASALAAAIVGKILDIL